MVFQPIDLVERSVGAALPPKFGVEASKDGEEKSLRKLIEEKDIYHMIRRAKIARSRYLKYK
jgi:hypothetical protein